MKSRADCIRGAAKALARHSVASLFGIVLWLAVAPGAHAQNAVCLSLVNELAGLDSRGGFVFGGDRRFKQYQKAVREQQAQITKTQRSARMNGCSQRRDAYCARIDASLAEMTSNLADLERNLAKLSPGG